MTVLPPQPICPRQPPSQNEGNGNTGPPPHGEQNSRLPFGWGAAPQEASGPTTPPAQRLTLPSLAHPLLSTPILNYGSGPALRFIAFIYYKRTSVCFLKRLSGQITVDKQH